MDYAFTCGVRIARGLSVVFVAAIASTACVADDGVVEYGGPADLVEQLEEEDIECSRLEVASADDSTVGLCEMSEEIVSIHVYEDTEAMKREIDATRDPNERLVVGSNWVVVVRSDRTAEAIRDAVGGRIE